MSFTPDGKTDSIGDTETPALNPVDGGIVRLPAGRTAVGVDAGSRHTCVLLDKRGRREVPFEADFTGFQIPDRFVVGYGLDYAEQYRNLPYLAMLD